MHQIFIHGLGQTPDCWNSTLKAMKQTDDILCVDLPDIIKGKEATYENIYAAFSAKCNEINGQLDLCGLSLGGVLALNYAIDYPGKVRSLVLIAAQYKMPKLRLGRRASNPCRF